MEMNLLQKKKRLRGKLPDIQICLGDCSLSRFILEQSYHLPCRYDRTTTQIQREWQGYGY